MNQPKISETSIANLLLDDIQQHAEPKERFDAIVRYELFTRGIWQRAQAENLRSPKTPS